MLKSNEGFSSTPYKDSRGITTIGYGRNLQDNPFTEEELAHIKDPDNITREEADWLFERDVKRHDEQLYKAHPDIKKLPQNVQNVLRDMNYQMGTHGVNKFRLMWSAIERGDFTSAAMELMDSDYAKQTPNRAKRNFDVLAAYAKELGV